MLKRMSPLSKGFSAFHDLIGLEFKKVENGCSECTLEFKDNLVNPYGTMHGGVIFAMADSGMGSALYSTLTEDEMCSTVESKIVYFKAVKSGTLTCASRIVHRGKRIVVLESEIGQNHQMVAKVIASWSVYRSTKD